MKKLLSILALLLLQNPLFSQGEGGVGNSSTYTTVIVSGLPRSLVRTSKINESPKTADTTVSVPPLTYSNLPAKATTSFEPEKINAASIMPRTPLTKLYRFYAKAGVGNYTMPLVELYVNDLYNKNGTWGAHAKHFSSQGGIKNVGYNGFSDNELGVYGKRFINKLEIGGEVDYKRNVVQYYGFNPDSFSIDKEDVRQKFNYIGATAYLSTYSPDSLKINHREELSYYFFSDAYGAYENFVKGGTALSKRMGKENYNLGFSFAYNNYVPTYNFVGCLSCLEDKVPGSTQQNVLVNLNPTVTSQGKNWIAKAGLKVTMDVYDGESFFHFYPDMEFRYSLFNDIFVPYIGIDGGVQRNSYKLLTDQNPFILNNFEIKNTNRKINVYGGIRGTWSSALSFNAKFSFTKTVNMALFVHDNVYSPATKYKVLFDDVDIISLSGQLTWAKTEKLKLFLRGEYFKYDATNEVKAWSMPDFVITGSGVYDLYDKILVKLDVFVIGSRYAKSKTFVDGAEFKDNIYAVKLKPFADINLGLEYRYTTRISAFLNVNNIAAKKYQYWYNYPVQGINILGGVTYSF